MNKLKEKVLTFYQENKPVIGFICLAGGVAAIKLVNDYVLHVPNEAFLKIGMCNNRATISAYALPRFWTKPKNLDLDYRFNFADPELLKSFAEGLLKMANEMAEKGGV